MSVDPPTTGARGKTDKTITQSIGAEARAVVIVSIVVLAAVFIVMLIIARVSPATTPTFDPVAAFSVFATPVVGIVTAYFGIRATSAANQALADKSDPAKEASEIVNRIAARQKADADDKAAAERAAEAERQREADRKREADRQTARIPPGAGSAPPSGNDPTPNQPASGAGEVDEG